MERRNLLNTLLRLTLKNETAFSRLPMPVFYDGTEDSVKYTSTSHFEAFSRLSMPVFYDGTKGSVKYTFKPHFEERDSIFMTTDACVLRWNGGIC